MRPLLSIAAILLLGAGCTCGPLPGSPQLPVMAVYENPLLLATNDYQRVWETVVDVVDNEFRIERETPVRCMGDALTEGRLDTFPLVGSTLLEPWRNDASTPYEKVEGTLQSIRRRATVRVIPAEGGQRVEVVVYKELEDAAQPIRGSAGAGTFRYDNSFVRIETPLGEQPITKGWIPMGRDAALEQKFLAEIQARVSGKAPKPIPICESTTWGGR
jgi:hypothetical protein